MRKTLESGQMKVTFPRGVTTERLGGRDFDVQCSEIQILGMTIQQKCYVAIIKGYALTITVSFTNDAEKAAVENVLNTVTFQ